MNNNPEELIAIIFVYPPILALIPVFLMITFYPENKKGVPYKTLPRILFKAGYSEAG